MSLTKYSTQLLAPDWLTHCSLCILCVFLSQNFDSFPPTGLRAPPTSCKQPQTNPPQGPPGALRSLLTMAETLVRDASPLILSCKVAMVKSTPNNQSPEVYGDGVGTQAGGCIATNSLHEQPNRVEQLPPRRPSGIRLPDSHPSFTTMQCAALGKSLKHSVPQSPHF